MTNSTWIRGARLKGFAAAAIAASALLPLPAAAEGWTILDERMSACEPADQLGDFASPDAFEAFARGRGVSTDTRITPYGTGEVVSITTTAASGSSFTLMYFSEFAHCELVDPVVLGNLGTPPDELR
jgi:hypothetical protein